MVFNVRICHIFFWDFCCSEILDIHIFFKSSFFGACEGISYSFQKGFSNNVSYAPIGYHLTFALKGFVTLDPDRSFDHNLCIWGLNEQCESTLSI
jgi:hypothetical protein